MNTPLRSIALVLIAVSLTSCSIPDHPEGMDKSSFTRMGDMMRSRGDDAAAADFYSRALQRNPKDNAARMALAGLFETHGDYANAATEYRAGIAETPDDAGLLRGLGRSLLKQGQAAEAKSQFEAALRLDSDDIKALNGMGVALDTLGQHQAAQSYYQKALDQNEDDGATLNNLAHSYILVGNYAGAQQLLEPHITSPFASPTLRHNLAEAYGMQGMVVDAERILKIDEPPHRVTALLAELATKRATMALHPKNYADMGAYATPALAAAKAAALEAKLNIKEQGLVLERKTSVKTAGGTPHFQILVLGFVNNSKLKSFCDTSRQQGFSCQPVAQ